MHTENGYVSIDSFTGDYRFLSNFYPAKVEYEGLVFPTVEHAYVAAKTFDLEKRDQIKNIPTPGQVKRFGRKLALRPDWDEVKLFIMYDLVVEKFKDRALQRLLLKTYPATLIEGNDWGDEFWGVDLRSGEGENHLGRILMEVRDLHMEGEE